MEEKQASNELNTPSLILVTISFLKEFPLYSLHPAPPLWWTCAWTIDDLGCCLLNIDYEFYKQEKKRTLTGFASDDERRSHFLLCLATKRIHSALEVFIKNKTLKTNERGEVNVVDAIKLLAKGEGVDVSDLVFQNKALEYIEEATKKAEEENGNIDYYIDDLKYLLEKDKKAIFNLFLHYIKKQKIVSVEKISSQCFVEMFCYSVGIKAKKGDKVFNDAGVIIKGYESYDTIAKFLPSEKKKNTSKGGNLSKEQKNIDGDVFNKLKFFLTSDKFSLIKEVVLKNNQVN